MVIVSVRSGVVFTADIDNNVTLAKLFRIARADQFGALEFLCLLQHPDREGLVAVR